MRILPLHMADFYDSNKRSVCINACNGYNYAGLESGHQCFCGNELPDRTLYRPGECLDSCPGSEAELCGDDMRINIFIVPSMHRVKIKKNGVPMCPRKECFASTRSEKLCGELFETILGKTHRECATECSNALYCHRAVWEEDSDQENVIDWKRVGNCTFWGKMSYPCSAGDKKEIYRDSGRGRSDPTFNDLDEESESAVTQTVPIDTRIRIMIQCLGRTQHIFSIQDSDRGNFSR